VQAPALQPAQPTHRPVAHWVSAVHQQGMPEATHVSVGEVAVLQLPIAHEKPAGAAASPAQLATSADPLPVHVPEHCDAALTHNPLEQSVSATQTHAL
jgi:hypothetical protein